MPCRSISYQHLEVFIMFSYLTALTGPENQSTLEDMALVEAVNDFGDIEPNVGQGWLQEQILRPTGYSIVSALAELHQGYK